MENVLRTALLYDFYSMLLTEKQRQVFEFYYFNDLSLNEIAFEMEVTAQAVSDLLKRTEKHLETYEEKLALVEKGLEVQKNIEAVITIVGNQSGISEDVKQEIIAALTDISVI
jgi:predicted DNA-binding protein YlxM (UPF0122 family)